MEIEYIPGSDLDYVMFIKNLGDKAVLTAIDRKYRWVITRDDSTQYIARPESAKPKNDE